MDIEWNLDLKQTEFATGLDSSMDDMDKMDKMDKLKEEYKRLKESFCQMENNKSSALIRKLDADDLKREAESRIMKLAEREMELKKNEIEQKKHYERDLHTLKADNDELKKTISDLNASIHTAQNDLMMLEEELQVNNKVPKSNINFVREETIKKSSSSDSDFDAFDTLCKDKVVINNPFVLRKGQALLTFEKEEVAKHVLRMEKHSINFDGSSVVMRASPIPLKRTIQFEVNTTICSKKMRICNLPDDISEEQIKDKLELTFYKPSIGGGEIEEVEYDSWRNEAVITFLDHGVVERILKQSQYELKVGDCAHTIIVEPITNAQLNKLQIFSTNSSRTVLLSEVKNLKISEEDIQDTIEIYFQKPSNGGGEVEWILYTQDKEIVPRFEDDL
ncbi:N-myc-interactor isoform X1 [Pelobates cultripes]|uniref:N-myc-interactor isoform X1 n=1 Tax=Pelobates cultripes TaxID=61616 RepID=A0AAD1WH60_PELCU|nr:N-myc-interactor isoform X1 [Pelobates cultripes]